MSPSNKVNRPLTVTFLAVGVFIFGAGQLWQAWAIYAQMALLLSLPTTFSPYARLAAALFWTVVALGLSLAVWRGWPRARLLVPVAGGVFLIYHLTLIVSSVSAMAERGWPGNLLLGIVLLCLVTWVLNRPAARPFFAHQRGQ